MTLLPYINLEDTICRVILKNRLDIEETSECQALISCPKQDCHMQHGTICVSVFYRPNYEDNESLLFFIYFILKLT